MKSNGEGECESYHCSQAPVAESSEPTYSDGTQSVTSNGTTTASACLPHESLMDSFHPHQSLATCVSSYSPVPLSNTEDLRTWLQQVSHANRTAQPENGLEQTTLETCGPQRGTLFAQLDPITRCWKTSQASLNLDMPASCSPIWPQWGMWVNGDAYELPMPALRTIEPDGGWLPTPRASRSYTNPATTRPLSDGDDCLTTVILGGLIDLSMRPNPSYVEWLMGWPIGWSRPLPVGMDKFRQWLQQHGDC